MAVTLQQVRAQLDREEPDYGEAAQLGPDAIPELLLLIDGGDPGLASKATYLAAFIDAKESAAVVEKAALSPVSVVRVAAAGSLRYLKVVEPPLVSRLLADNDAGVRHLALQGLEVHPLQVLKPTVQQMALEDSDQIVRQLASKITERMQ